MAKLFLENLTKAFGDLVAVNDFTLEVKDGEFISLLGPSGCGKTTTMRMIAGLLEPDKGKVFIGDTDVTELPPEKRNVGLVFQSWAPFTHMSVYDNLAFGLKIRKKPKDETKAKVAEVVELLRLEDVINIKAGKIPAYEMQKVAIGRTLVTNPSILLLDEPISNLDAPLRVVMIDKFKEFHRDLRQTIVYVTHDQSEAMKMAERIAVMDSGILKQYDTVDVIYDKPADKFVANFIGTPTMNFIDCTFVEKDTKALLDTGVFTIDVTEYKELIKERRKGPELIIGIRPGDIKISDERVSEESVNVSVDITEFSGPDLIVHFRADDITIRAFTSSTLKVSPGEMKWIDFDREKIHIFDKKTEEAII